MVDYQFTGNIVNGSVTTAKLADDAVTTPKIKDVNVTLAKVEAAIKGLLYLGGEI